LNCCTQTSHINFKNFGVKGSTRDPFPLKYSPQSRGSKQFASEASRKKK